MGRRALWSSAAAGVSLIAAALVMVAAVSTLIAFRGFRGVQASPAAQSVVIDAATARETGGTPAPTPGAVVIGGERRSVARQARRPAIRRARATRSRARRARAEVARRPARSGLASPTAQPAPVTATVPVSASAPAPATAPRTPATSPVDRVVEDAAGVLDEASPGEKVGEVLLDIRDVLP